MKLLTDEEIAAQLAAVPAWERQGDSIVTTVTRTDFRDALLYLGAVAYLAEAAGRHAAGRSRQEISRPWTKVPLRDSRFPRNRAVPIPPARPRPGSRAPRGSLVIHVVQ